MASLPPPPSGDWALTITEAVESLLIRMDEVERVTHIVVQQAELEKQERDLHVQQNTLNDSLLIQPIPTMEIPKKRKLADFQEKPTLDTTPFKPYM